jgi:hypothetical protein
MLEVHGVCSARSANNEARGVFIKDDSAKVCIQILHEYAWITPDEARFIARHLLAAANRVEKNSQ